MPNDELVSTVETARLMGLTPSGISRRVRRGALTPAAKGPGIRGAYFFRRVDVEALVDQQVVEIDRQQPAAQAISA